MDSREEDLSDFDCHSGKDKNTHWDWQLTTALIMAPISLSFYMLLESEAMPFCFCVDMSDSTCLFMSTFMYACGKQWKTCQIDVGVQTDGRQASGQLAFTAVQKSKSKNLLRQTTSAPYPHSVILSAALLPFKALSLARGI